MSGRFFGHRELHLVLLALLARRPMHGYELMGELRDRFGPAYRPSAGSVYPAIEALAAEDLISPESGSDPTTYTLTPTGNAALTRRSADLLNIEQRTGVILGTYHSVEAALIRVGNAARAAATRDTLQVERLLTAVAVQLESNHPKETP